MSRDKDLWKEIDDAVVEGFIYQLDEISQPYVTKSKRMYGTRVWFNGRVTSEQCEQVAHYIRKRYDLMVDQHLPFCLIIWHPDQSNFKS
jgi:hypothetical protein